MTTKELKTKIHNDVDNLSDNNILEMMNIILDTYKGNSLKISDKHKFFLEESEKSKVLSDIEAKQLVNEWLKD